MHADCFKACVVALQVRPNVKSRKKQPGTPTALRHPEIVTETDAEVKCRVLLEAGVTPHQACPCPCEVHLPMLQLTSTMPPNAYRRNYSVLVSPISVQGSVQFHAIPYKQL